MTEEYSDSIFYSWMYQTFFSTLKAIDTKEPRNALTQSPIAKLDGNAQAQPLKLTKSLQLLLLAKTPSHSSLPPLIRNGFTTPMPERTQGSSVLIYKNLPHPPGFPALISHCHNQPRPILCWFKFRRGLQNHSAYTTSATVWTSKQLCSPRK